MALQLVDLYLPASRNDLDEINDDITILERWLLDIGDEKTLVRYLLDTEHTEHLIETLHKRVGSGEEYRLVVTNVEATLPKPEDTDEEEDEEEGEKPSISRISREELYQDVDDSIRVTSVHYTLVILSTVVAAIGMLRNSVAVVIGAMVIAPLIGPNIALALATTLGDTSLLKRALHINIIGITIAFVLSVGAGLAFVVDPESAQIAARTNVNLADVVLALAAGVAGTLAMTRGISTALIGVMVAVALLPPLVAVGLLVGAAYWELAYRAIILLITNITAINLAGVVTFIIQGIRPMSWYESEKAKKATRVAIALWIAILALLVTAILLADPISL